MARHDVARLNGDGTLDRTFTAGVILPAVGALTLQADGRILAGIDALPSSTVDWFGPRIARLNSDGSVDTTFASFNPEGDASERSALVQSIAAQTDGKIYLAGNWENIHGYDGSPRLNEKLTRQNSDGTKDYSVNNPDYIYLSGNGFVQDEARGLALQPNGSILIAGLFHDLVAATTRNWAARFINDGVATQNVSADSHSSIRWTRSGSSPELSRATFELSTDGITYTMLGQASRIAGTSNWRMTGLNLPAEGLYFYARARGYYSTGWHNGSGSMIQSTGTIVLPFPVPLYCLGDCSTVFVRLRDPAYGDIVDATVYFTDPKGNVTAATAGKSGDYELDNAMPGGSYRIDAKSSKYQFKSTSVLAQKGAREVLLDAMPASK
jgi:uncharacterized delta-60 repeat protein